jgi:outer membrane immunogenic protein
MRLSAIVFGVLASLVPISTAAAADSGFMADPIYDSPMFNFDGVYVGVQVGGDWQWTPAPGVITGDIGALAGANFTINNSLLFGVEFQANALVDMNGFQGWDALFMGHFGGFITDSAILYAAAGAGTTDASTVYALGAGVEAAVADQLSVRGEVLALAPWGAMPAEGKATLGLIWHMQ